MLAHATSAVRRRVRAVGGAILLVVAATAVTRAAPPLAPGAIEQGIVKARGWLAGQQRGDGSWDANPGDGSRDPSGLVLLALANAGLGPDEPAVRKGLDRLRSLDPQSTYQRSLQTLALAMLSPQADRAILERNVAWLEKAQKTTGPAAGSWSYDMRAATAVGDNSNSQFALLALHEAARAGVRVKRETWTLAQQYWMACANPDGSWGYTIGTRGGSGSMTCAGIASMWITAEHLGTPAARADGGDTVKCCGGAASPQELERGLAWLGSRFSVTENPGVGGPTWLFYYLYGLERVGRFSARRYIGEADWYREGAGMLVGMQDRLTGRFTAPRLEDPVVATSFALLFLAKGRRPVIVAKSRHGPASDWNRHGHEVAHLVEHVERRWRKEYPAGLSWHVVETPAASRDDLLQAPVLWLSGKDAFDLGPDAGPRLRRYVDDGGFIFAEACCPESKAFDRRFRQLVGEIFPEPEHGLHLLPPEHPAWHAEEIVPPELHRALLGVDYGCRTCIIYAPPADGLAQEAMPSLACLWELGGGAGEALPAPVRREVDAALAIGTNVLAYATNREVKRKDELFALPADADQPAEPLERGRIAIAKLKHAGMCDAAPAALANVLRAAARELGVLVDDTPARIDPGDRRLFDYHLVFMHGRQAFEFDRPRREKIATFLDRGGTLLADAVCANAAFAAAFRAEMALILPDRTLQPIPPDDPMFTAAEYGGYDIRQVELREPAGGDGPLGVRKRRVPPRLEGVRIGDRWAVIFSPYDLSCALERANSMECTGYGRDDAEKIALNVLLYSLNH